MGEVNRRARRNCLLDVPYCVEPEKTCKSCLEKENRWARKWVEKNERLFARTPVRLVIGIVITLLPIALVDYFSHGAEFWFVLGATWGPIYVEVMKRLGDV